MKKLFLVVVVLFSLGHSMHAQDVDLGITAGYLNARGVLKFGDESFSNSQSGFYAGAIADLEITEKINIQSEALYARADGTDRLMIPILGKFKIAEKFNIQVGPQLVFALEGDRNNYSEFEFDIATGFGYDITEDFFMEARYTFQINNTYTGSEDIKVRGNYLTVGLGYKFL